MKSLSHNTQGNQDMKMRDINKKYGMQEEDQNDNESVYDEFAEIKFTDEEWRQKAWDVLGLLWYHEESQAFLEPVSENDLGPYYAQYLRVIEYPMDFGTMKEKFKGYQYSSLVHFMKDVHTVFKNCQVFNDETSEIHKASAKLERFYWREMKVRGLSDGPSMIRIN